MSELLDKVYELEGLLSIALSRDEIPQRLEEMIAARIEELAGYRENRENLENQENRENRENLIYRDNQDNLDKSDNPDNSDYPDNPDNSDYPDNPDDSYYIVEDDEPEPITPLTPITPTPPSSPRQTGRLVFSINDRYRYRRELFGGVDADFNDALSRVAAMDSYDEAEEYFIDELQWDPERPEVVDFMAVLRNYFEV